MKKLLPLILLGLGIVVVVLGFVFVKNQKKTENPVDPNDESALVEVPSEKRPVVSLIPSADGHYLKLKVEKLVIDASSFDYELLYQTKADITQGVPGTADLKDKNSFETDLLLGTESSGKFRYDDGVQTGSIELKFRNKEGKLTAKFLTEFHMQTGVTELTSPDTKFTYILDKSAKGVFFVTMQTVGVPGQDFKAVISKDGYSIFASDSLEHKGSVK